MKSTQIASVPPSQPPRAPSAPPRPAPRPLSDSTLEPPTEPTIQSASEPSTISRSFASDPFAPPPSRVSRTGIDGDIETIVDNARAQVSMARRYLVGGGTGFAASSAHLAMLLLADALVLRATGKFYAARPEMLDAFRRFVVDVETMPPDCLRYLLEGASFAIDPLRGDYVGPPSADRAREEVDRAERFLGEAVGALGLMQR